MDLVPYLIPTPLNAPDTPCLLPYEQVQVTRSTDSVVEAGKTVCLRLKRLGITASIQELNLQTLNEHTDLKTLPGLFRPSQEGRSVGIVSEAGCPTVADPGADLVALVRMRGSEAQPLVGPSGLLPVLMASGANGQSFVFKGYLPPEKDGRIQALKALGQHSRKYGKTQIFIEAPYRSDTLLTDAVGQPHPVTQLCVACDLTLPVQTIIGKTVVGWHELKKMPNLEKQPAIFVLYAA